MLEKMFTTKMSADKKKLQSRFLKIRSNNGKAAKLFSGILFVIFIVAIIAASVIIAANNAKDYRITDAEFSDYANRPLGSIMAELDYVDDEKLVFHYLEGFFVIDQESNEILHKINLNKLNIAGHSQGDCFTEFKIDKNGRFAYLTNDGQQDMVQKFNNYIINLETGDVKIGTMPDGTELFTDYGDTISTVKDIDGWASQRCIIDGNQRTYYLTVQDSVIGAIQLVTIHHKADNIGARYVFGKNYITLSQQKANIINDSLNDNEEILTNSGFEWEVNADTVKLVLDKLRETKQMKLTKIEPGNYDVKIYHIDDGSEAFPMIFVIDNYSLELLFSTRLSKEDYTNAVNILNHPSSDLYNKTVEFLENEFRRVYTPLYDIQNLTVSNWQENGNEATFFYNMTYLNYNRDPDKAEYIQEAKERSQEEYETLYNDYLALKEGNYQFKVILKGDDLDLYSNIAPRGTEWVPTKIDDYIISNWGE